MKDTIFYKLPNECNNNTNSSVNSGYPYNFDGRSFIVINNTGIQTVVFLPENLYPDEV